jgi:Sulfotransferase family
MPQFLGIGAMRSGTSWLASHLGRHPSIWLRRKEIHFFDRKLHKRRIPLLEADLEARIRYGLRFLPARLKGLVFGEFTPSYAILEPDRIDRIHRWMPEAKLLFVMRDPVERIWSQVRHDFPRWLGLDPRQAPKDRLIDFIDSPRVRLRSDYATCLSHWLGHYPRDQFFLTFLEEIVSDPERVLASAFSFLEVPPYDMSPDVSRPVHSSEGPGVPDWVRERLGGPLSRQNERLAELVGRPLPWAG